MKIVDIVTSNVRLSGNIANAVVSFKDHDVSLVAVVSDVMRQGCPVIGFAFNSIGRYAQRGIILDRLRPRLLQAAPEALLDESGNFFSAGAVYQTMMTNEKPGGHGDRASAIGAIELAIWDLNAKLADKPAYQVIAEQFGRDPIKAVPVYAAGGYYYPPDATRTLSDELQEYQALGFDTFKIKVGGSSVSTDLKRIEEAIAIAGSGQKVAVDVNGRFNLQQALEFAKHIEGYDLCWYEEVGDPLDYSLNHTLTQHYPGAVATGENLFSSQDVLNLVNFGGMRAQKDVFQMDAALSYGLTEYAKMIDLLEARGFDRRQMHPHGGHMINLHIVTGLGLGGCEAYPGVFKPFGGYADSCEINEGCVRPGQAPGFGLEEKAGIAEAIEQLV